MNQPLLDQQSAMMEGEKISVQINVRRRLPDFLQSVNLKYVKLGYHYLIRHLLTLLFIPLLFGIFLEVSRMGTGNIYQHWEKLQFNLLSVIMCSALLVVGVTVYVMSRPRQIFLVDFACYLPPDNLKVLFQAFMERTKASGYFDEKSVEFQRTLLDRSGLGESTYLPPALHADPQNPSMETAREEAAAVIFSCLDELFEKTGVKPKDIGVLVVNCSLFSPTPSLSAMIINKYKMRGNIKNFNLGGMGCSASVIAVDLVNDILQVHRDTRAIVVSTENITQNWYRGNRRSMLIPNCLFRVGGAAILLSNKLSDRRRSKYRLKLIVRTHKGADDNCFQCINQCQDDKGFKGVVLSKDLMPTAGLALKTNITTLGPLVLPFSEQFIFFAVLVGRKVFGMNLKPYIPDFKLAFEHFCIHAGGRAVIDEVQKNLQLTQWHCEPSRMALHRFGNTSSSTIWYELAYTEAKERISKGDRVWQIAFGAGFKCNSAVWQALRTVKRPSAKHNAWIHCIDEYPVKVPDI